MADYRKSEKNYLKLELDDFGPINRAKFNIKPLTVFIGSNNSGKSYSAMLLRSISRCTKTNIKLEMNTRSPLRFLIYDALENRQSKELKRLIDHLKSSQNEFMSDELKIPKEYLEDMVKKVFDNVYHELLQKEINHSFASSLNELIRSGKESFKIKINGFELKYNDNNFKVVSFPEITYPKNDRVELIEFRSDENNIIVRSRRWKYLELDDADMLIYSVIRPIISAYVSNILINLSFNSLYLPAARSGIIQGHKVFTAGMFQMVPLLGQQELKIPKFSGVIADFLASIVELPPQKGPYYDLAVEFEKEIIEGNIIVKKGNEEYHYPEYSYKISNLDIPLHRSSSTVSELAPLFLYLKYLVEPNSTLIIEEPEAHLHPKNQRILAKYLVKLIRNDIKLIITTHSDYLVEQLNNFILLGKMNRIKRLKCGYQQNDFLKEEEVAVYLLESDKNKDGYNSKEIEINENGISQDSFVEVLDSLYDETHKIKRQLTSNLR